MGNKTAVSYSKEELESFRIATVKRSNEEGASLYDLFLSTKSKSEDSVNLTNFKEIFVMPHDDYKQAPKDGKITCDFVIKFDYFICIKRTKESLYNKYKVHTESQQLAESTEYTPEKEEMKLIFIHSDFKQECLYFEDREEFEETEELFKSVNNVKGRKIAVLVNPVSGKRLARKYFREILSPILNISGITYDNFMTDSSTYVEEWVNLYEKDSFPYTDIICIGGDGLFSQLVNALGKSPKSKELLKIPIGLLPCGSANAICCDLGGKDVYQACINIIRGVTVKADILKVKFKEQEESIYATSMLWGITGDIVHKAEKWRRCLKSARYAVCGAKTLLCSCSLKNYKCKIEFKNTKKDLDSQSYYFEEGSKVCDSTDKTSKNSDAKSDRTSKNDKDGWKTYENDEFTFFCVTTHECRSSINKKEIFMPPIRINDGTMRLGCLKRCGKVKMLKFLSKFSSAKHLEYKMFEEFEVSELKLSPIVNSYFNIDGEIYPNDEAHVKLLPSYLNLIGKLHEK
ncbi:unnamed protein product [Moneuplotes crassus]|uniref:DAGKc domain-containing protein n=1 Tax=Euplotes crassus TaxID=5936 RepID=A0AAD1X6Q7_EUPCR|nr:unnamed protein product [Moneuplotes crassus]